MGPERRPPGGLAPLPHRRQGTGWPSEEADGIAPVGSSRGNQNGWPLGMVQCRVVLRERMWFCVSLKASSVLIL